MADETTTIASSSPEEVAYKLLLSVAAVEGKSLGRLAGIPYVSSGGDRKWLLDAYAECLDAVKDNRTYPKA